MNSLGVLSVATQKYEDAEQYLHASHDLCQQLGYTRVEAAVKGNLSELFLRQKAYEDAEKWALEAFAIHQDLKDPGGMLNEKTVLIESNTYTSRFEKARVHCLEGVDIAQKVEELPYVCAFLTSVALFLAEDRRPDWFGHFVSDLLLYPSTEQQNREKLHAIRGVEVQSDMMNPTKTPELWLKELKDILSSC